MDVFAWCLGAGCLILLIIAVCWVRAINLREAHDFNIRFPPISDEEFLRRCGPGTNPTIALKVREIIAEQLAIPVSQIYPEQELVADLHCD